MDRASLIVYNCGLLTYPLSYWAALADADWEELLVACPDEAHILDSYRKYDIGDRASLAAYSQARTMAMDDSLNKISWILGPHIIYGEPIDYLGIVPRDIVGEIARFLRVDHAGELPNVRITSFLGVMHSWDDRPTITHHLCDGIYYEWYHLGELHREGDRPAIVSLDPESYNFSWYKNDRECREGNAPSYMQLHCQGQSYAVQSPPITTTNPRVIAEIDALAIEYKAYV